MPYNCIAVNQSVADVLRKFGCNTSLRMSIAPDISGVVRGADRKLVLNHGQQYSIWPNGRINALGSTDEDTVGTKAECLSYIAQRHLYPPRLPTLLNSRVTIWCGRTCAAEPSDTNGVYLET